VEERGGTLTVLNCGHPAPLLLRNGEVISLDPPSPAPPLGFLPVAQPRVERLEPGDRLLLYTDGLAEARRNGEFFPVNERAWRILGHGTVEDGLTSLENALKDWVRGVLDDDIALVLLEYAGAGAGASSAPATPAWEWGGALGD
jgi:sigma-B regulation protein RsbU (phosphoserine phosphatase)